MDVHDHPVIAALREARTLQPTDLDFFARHGRPFEGAELPPGIERWPAGECILAAQTLSRRHGWKLQVGFAILPPSVVGDRTVAQFHAWCSDDGEHAIDGVWPDPPNCRYFGLDRRHAGWLNAAIDNQEMARKRRIPPVLIPGAYAQGLRRQFGLR